MYFSLNKVLHTPSVFLRDNLSHQEFREITQHDCKKKKGGGTWKKCICSENM